MLNASQLGQGWHQLLSRFGSAEELEATAKASGALLRCREIKSAGDLLRLALAYGPCGMSLRTAAAWAETIGLASLSDVAVMKRLQASADWLQEVAGQLLAGCLAGGPAVSVGRIIRLVDSTTISEPGSDRADWRLHYSYDPREGRAVAFELTTSHHGEHLRRVKVAAGDIWVADRGYAKGDGLHHLVQSEADFVVRVSWNSLSLRTAHGKPFDMAKRLKRLGKAERAEWKAFAVTPSGETVPLRLVVRRKPPEAIEREIKRIKEKAARRGRTRRGGKPDPRSLIAARFTVLATSLAEPAGQIFDLYALRWQIEIAFKRLKSQLHIDRLQAKHPDLARTWLLAHMIAALLIEDHADKALDSPPSALRCAA
jgi:Transposase DDE domain